jgi:hypothetical protein
MDENVFDPTYGGADLTYTGTSDTTDWYNNYIADLEFDQDWADVVSGRFTIDEVTGDQDIAANTELLAFGSDWTTAISNLASKLGKGAFNALKNTFTKNGEIDWAALATAGVALYNQSKGSETGGYNKPVPKMDLVREQVPYDNTNRRPGQDGRQYFTDSRFTPQGDTAAKDAALQASLAQRTGLVASAPQYAAPAANPYAGKIPTLFSEPRVVLPTETSGLLAVPTREQTDMQNQKRTFTPMAQGGIADAGRYLQGDTDGMADEIPSSIDGEQPAALSHGEFVIPADVVSHLGNGNSDAGAEKLYEMMARIRKARTGTTKQGEEIDAEKFTMGGLTAAYAQGGKVKGFNGTAGSAVIAGPNTTASAATGAGGVPLDTSRTSTLSPWVGDYVTNALGQGAALANAPYQAYGGPLTAGASDLQQQAFAGASDIATAGFTPGEFSGGFGAKQAAQYMNPYLQASLEPQLKELQRQSDIARLDDASRLTKAGAFGGSRQAIMESEGRRNLLDKQAGLIGSGYKSAYDTGLGQFNKERESEEASRQFGANFGLKTVDQLANMGAVERGITSEGLAADKKQFEEERDFAYKMPQYQLGLLQGLPIGSNTTAVNQDAVSKLQSDVSGLAALYKTLANLGVKA